MTELGAVLAAFRDATGCAAAVWGVTVDGTAVALASAVPDGLVPPGAATLLATGTARVSGPEGDLLVAAIPGPRKSWLSIGPCGDEDAMSERYLAFLVPVVAQYLKASLEVEHAASELAERYEEINLLYTTSEILGRTVRLDEAAATILTEISETVGARRGAILVHDRVTGTLQVVASLQVRPEDAEPIGVDDQASVSARVFRTQHAVIAEASDPPCDAETPYRRGAMLSVPILWAAPDTPETLGVVNLSDRRSGQQFSAGDQKLVQAIAAQIGTAIQNTRLVRSSLAQQRLVQEMELAHDLQMRLLPRVAVALPDATVAARVVPADSVGGDFYHLFQLGSGRVGVMIGDVSSHGYRAALIMALAMSAAAIHAQGSDDPAATLASVQGSLGEELETTEMFITAFYAVLDRRRGLLHWANTGHPHAFAMDASGHAERLRASDPPVGMLSRTPARQERAWGEGDLLLLFTDGVSDARNRAGATLGEEPILGAVAQHRHEAPQIILDRVFEVLEAFTGETPQRDDITLVVVKI